MERAGTWDSTAILLTSDHWWRQGQWRTLRALSGQDAAIPEQGNQRVPFLLKLPGQRAGVEYSEPFNTVLVHDLILALLRDRLREPEGVRQWLAAQKQQDIRPVVGNPAH